MIAPIEGFISRYILDNEIDRKIDVTAILFLLVQNRHQTHGWTLIASGANGLGILLEWFGCKDIGTIKLEFVANAQSLYSINRVGFMSGIAEISGRNQRKRWKVKNTKYFVS